MIPPPSLDPFYDSVHPPWEPGDPIRVREVEISTAQPTWAWQLVHGSTDTLGRRNVVSGTVLRPTVTWPGPGPRPVVSFGVGVHGLGRDAAPGYLLRSGQEFELPLIERALALGWVVAVSDGEGLGMPGPHTYGAGRAGGQALLDVVRAVGRIVPDVRPDSPVLLWGYSEGGRNAAWAAELQPSYAPDLPLVAVAAGGVPADLYANALSLDVGPFTGLNLAVTIGLAHAYGEAELWAALTDAGRTVADHAATLDIVGLLTDHPQPLAAHTHRSEPWNEPRWRQVLERERAGQRPPSVPTYLYHVADDEIVPAELGRRLAEDYRAGGAEVTWVEVDASDHLSGSHLGAQGALAWLADRLTAGQTRLTR